MTKTVFLLGATGLFGGHLARALIARGYDVVLAARSKAKLEAFAKAHGGRACVFDRDAAEAEAQLRELQPFVVVDAAGPFQAYGDDPYRFARAALNAGAHYIDLADAPQFVNDINTLDSLAKKHGLTALSGVSSTPALSGVVVKALAEGFDHTETIETAIMPGNRTERGLSVIRAILAQVGQKFRLWRGGRWETVRGWSKSRHLNFEAGGRRLKRRAALHEAPETVLFPSYFGAKTVVFRAGLELAVLHKGLSLGALMVRLGVLKNLVFLSKVGFRVSSWLKGLGSDAGGMSVRVLGQRRGVWERRVWDIVAPDGVGPQIPALPAELMIAKLLEGQVSPGARPAITELELSEIESALVNLGVMTEQRTARLAPLFASVLGEDFAKLAPPIQELHGQLGVARFRGRANVTGASTFLGHVAARIVGFPASVNDIEVNIEIDADETREIWQRDFGGHTFCSTLTQRGSHVAERFGPLSFTLGLKRDGESLLYPVLSARFLGLPLPRFLTPRSESSESVDDQGRFTFDVKISLPIAGLVAHYRGWLVPNN